MWYKWQVPGDNRQAKWKLIVPHEYRLLVMQLLHDAPTARHFGMERSLKSLEDASRQVSPWKG